jgi:hypothetical protein
MGAINVTNAVAARLTKIRSLCRCAVRCIVLIGASTELSHRSMRAVSIPLLVAVATARKMAVSTWKMAES